MLQPAILSAKPLDERSVKLTYADGEERIFDVSPYIHGPWFGELREAAYFRSVRVSPGGSGIEWPNGQDIAPHELYDLSVPAPRGKLTRERCGAG